MNEFLLNDKDAINCLDYIRDNADKLAEARSTRNHLEKFRKSKRALIIRDYDLECVGKIKLTDKQRENYALCHPEYTDILDGLRVADHLSIKLDFLMIAAQEKLKIYQTICANNRQATS